MNVELGVEGSNGAGERINMTTKTYKMNCALMTVFLDQWKN